MHDDLKECITAAKAVRDGVAKGSMDVKTANAVTGANHTILTAHALDLRSRMFNWETGGKVAGMERGAIASPEQAAITSPAASQA